MPRIAIVTTHPEFFTAADPDRDCAPLVAALRARGVEAESVAWRDETADWSAYDLAVIRSPWDYSLHADEFAAWLSRTGTRTRILNEPELVRWNMDKRYLQELEAAGVAVVPTTWHTDEASLRAALAEHADGAHVVIKPAVGAGSQDTGLFARADAGAPCSPAAADCAGACTRRIRRSWGSARQRRRSRNTCSRRSPR